MPRKKVKIDWEVVEHLIGIHCTKEEIAYVVGYEIKTVMRRCRLDLQMDFDQLYKKHSANAKASLRRAMFQAAVKEGNTAMMIFLAKNLLGMRDKQDVSFDGLTPAELLEYLKKDDSKRKKKGQKTIWETGVDGAYEEAISGDDVPDIDGRK